MEKGNVTRWTREALSVPCSTAARILLRSLAPELDVDGALWISLTISANGDKVNIELQRQVERVAEAEQPEGVGR